MDKQFHKTKILTVILMLFCSSLLFICPIGKSAPVDQIYECTPNIVLEYNQTLLEQPIFPYDQPKEIPLTVKISIGGPEADIVLSQVNGGALVIVHLSIAEVSEGCHASINPPIAQVSIPKIPNEYVSANASLSLTIDQYLPAFSLETVKVSMISERLGKKATIVSEGNFTQDVPFTVGYFPQLSFSYPDGNVKSISPGEMAYFTIGLQNFGNADTRVDAEVVDIPKGWKADVLKSTTLGTNLTSNKFKEAISLNVKPPIDFGYHEDRAVIKVKMTPECYKNSTYKGEPYYLYFIVQSKGISAATPGFEMGSMLLAFIIVIFFIWKRKKQYGGKE